MSIKDLYLEYEDRIIFNHIDFNIDDNDRIGIVGVNGSGKSSLLKYIAYYNKLDDKKVMVKKNLKIAYLMQDLETSNIDILAYIMSGQSNDVDLFEAKKILNKLGIFNYELKMNELSGGQQKRVALAKVLVAKADLLLLDEPTNHLDYEMIQYIEMYLKSIKIALVIISHDRYFLDNLANKIVEVEDGNISEYNTNYNNYLELKAMDLESKSASNSKLVSLLKTETKWMKQGAKARSSKSKHRIEKYNELKKQTQIETKQELKLDSLQQRMGKKILEINNLSVGYEDTILVKDFNYTFKKNDVVGLIGLNGSGKSTFLNAIVNNENIISGNLDFGTSIKIGYFAQNSSTELDDNQRVIDYVESEAKYIETKDGQISASLMLEQFLFKPSMQYSYIKKLSGGEKRRLMLLKILMKAPNFLVLDEPTNDLDTLTLSILEDYLLSFSGVIIIASHDRYFMERLTNSLWLINNRHINISNDSFLYYIKSQKTSIESNEKTTKATYQKEKKMRFTYEEQKDFITIDQRISKLEEELELINQSMMNYSDYDMLASLEIKQKEKSLELEKANERWLYLNEKNEEIENQ